MMNKYNVSDLYVKSYVLSKSNKYRVIYKETELGKQVNDRFLKLFRQKSVDCFLLYNKTSLSSYFIPHFGNRYFLKLDIKNFFQSITLFNFLLLTNVFSYNKFFYEYFSNLPDQSLQLGIPSCSYAGNWISNIILSKLNSLLENNTKLERARVSVYVDDILISYKNKVNEKELLDSITLFFNIYRLKLNTSKIRFIDSHKETVKFLGLNYNKNKRITVGHKRKKICKALVHKLINGQFIEFEDILKARSYINFCLSNDSVLFKQLRDKYGLDNLIKYLCKVKT